MSRLSLRGRLSLRVGLRSFTATARVIKNEPTNSTLNVGDGRGSGRLFERNKKRIGDGGNIGILISRRSAVGDSATPSNSSSSSSMSGRRSSLADARRKKLINCLIDSNASVGEIDEALRTLPVTRRYNGMSLLSWAARHDRFESLKKLLETYGDQINVNEPTTVDRSTPFLLAADKGSAELLSYLLALPQCDKGVRDAHGLNALERACKNGNLENAKLLMESGLFSADGCLLLPTGENPELEHIDVASSPASPLPSNAASSSPPSSADDPSPVSSPNPPIIRAVRNNHLAIVKWLVDEQQVSVESVVEETQTSVLSFAVGYGNRELIQFLLDRGANVASKNIHGDNALHWACRRNRCDILVDLLVSARRQVLVAAGLEEQAESGTLTDEHAAMLQAKMNEVINARIGSSLLTPLHLASDAGLLDIVFVLLVAGADPSLCTGTGDTPLIYASQQRSGSAQLKLILSWLLDSERPSASQISELAEALRIDNISRIMAFKNPTFSIPKSLQSSSSSSPLFTTSSSSDSLTRFSLLNHLNCRGVSAILSALHTEVPGNVKLLLDAGVSLKAPSLWSDAELFVSRTLAKSNASDEPVLGTEAPKQSNRVSEHLADTIVVSNRQHHPKDEGKLQTTAVERDASASEQKPQTRPTSPNKQTSNLRDQIPLNRTKEFSDSRFYHSPLNAAVRRSTELTKLIVEHFAESQGSDAQELINARDGLGNTALHCAATAPSEAVVRVAYLLSKGADPSLLDRRGNTAGHLAAATGSADVLELLLQSGLDPHQMNHSKESIQMIFQKHRQY